MEILYTILFFLLGITLTSFFQLIGERLPKSKSINGRSECDSCKHTLRWIDIVPVLGYLINLGKCHFCEKKIPISYLLMELIGGILFAISYLYLGFSLNLVIACIMLSVFIVETSSDVKYSTVIDTVWIIGLLFLVIIRIIQNNFLEYLLSASVLFFTLFAIASLGKAIYKKEALGGGDIKLYIFIGFLVTIWNGLLSLFLASVFALIYAIIKKKRNTYIPLVPFISIAVVLTFFYGDSIINWYLNLFGM